MYQHLLVPTDGSDLASESVERAIEFALAIGARITFVTARADYSASDEGAILRTIEPSRFEMEAAGPARGIIVRAEISARARGVSCQSVIKTSNSPAETILSVASELDCDLIFMASRGMGGLRGLFVGSQTQKVLAQTTIPVLISAVEKNRPKSNMRDAIAKISKEHRSIAAITYGLQYMADGLETKQISVDPALIKGMIHYLKTFPGRLHHPKEERYIFKKLRGKENDLDRAIEELELQHRGEGELLMALELASDTLISIGDVHPFSLALDEFSKALWKHMGTEERSIIPSAKRLLNERDWEEISSAFLGNSDPIFDKEVDLSFQAMFSRVANLMPTYDPLYSID